MRLRRINYNLPENKKLSVKEDVPLEYPNIVGVFGKNGVGKTRFLKAVYNTIQAASGMKEQSYVENMQENALHKVLFLNVAEILMIKHGDMRREPEEISKCDFFDATEIDKIGLQKYIIENGRKLLAYIGMQWTDIQELPREDSSVVFFELFNSFFPGGLRTVVNRATWNPEVQVGELDIDKYALSDGEWIEIFYLLLIAATKYLPGKYEDAIILIDEIENYLNPQSIRNILMYLEKTFGKEGQLWIASHSLDVLLYLNSRNCFCLERRNKETFIHKPDIANFSKIREELYGNDIDAQLGQSFREDEMKHYFSEFMIQCLKEPETVKCINQNDIQLRLFLKCLDKQKKKIDILDFGAGEGRIGKALNELNDKRISYYAYDIEEENIRKIRQMQFVKQVYASKEEISKKFDVILLCNVLHEICVWCWEDDLNFIFSRLKENGILIFIEDLELPVGEYIDETGFLLLDGEMSANLFGQEKVSLILAEEEKYRDRILCAAVNSKAHVSKEDILETLNLLKKRSLEKTWQIRRNRKDDFTSQPRKLGSEMARAAQLAVNADIALEYLRGVDAASVKNMRKFVKYFADSVVIVKNKGTVDRQELALCLEHFVSMLAEERESDWVVQGNVALTGTLLQKMNSILEKGNIKIYTMPFENVANLYIKLKIAQYIADNDYRKLMSRLMYLDICWKYKSEFDMAYLSF